MKLLFTLCVAICFAGVFGDADLTNAEVEGRKHVKECAEKNNITPQTIEELKEKKTFTVSQDTKCFAFCLGEGSGLVDAEGKPAAKFTGNEEVTNCQKSITGTDKCDITAQLVDCLVKKEDFQHLVLVS